MSLNLRMYHALVNKVPGIQERYHKYRDHLQGAQRAKAWGYLISLNLQYYLFHNKSLEEPVWLHTDEKKQLCKTGCESALSLRENPVDAAERLSQYDIISFDVFDTLIFRCFDKPTAVFYMVGQELGYLDFERIRREIEWKTREKKYEQFGHYEVTFEEIWEFMEEETGIPAHVGQTAEWQAELKYCFANPYWKEVIRELRSRNKKVVITSDMYLREAQIRELLRNVGYPEFDAYFVSCEYRKSKSDGSLFDEVRKTFGSDLKYIHIGDNLHSDQKKAGERGFQTELYRNVNTFGRQFRSEDMSAITGSLYRGIINAHLHNGVKSYPAAYEFGFVYGGLFVLGYCRFIHQYVQIHDIDKILFLARDGDILNQVYQRLYPEEERACEYVYWSRLAATKMAARYFKYDYFRRFLYHKVNQDYTLQQIFASMELDDMLPEYLELQGHTDSNEKLTLAEAKEVQQYLQQNWDTVLSHYDEQLQCGKQYYEKILHGCHRAVAVDVGWAGSGAVALDYIANQLWGLDCEIIGLLAGTNSAYNAEPESSEPQLNNGKLENYLFSQNINRDVWKYHNPAKGHNIIVEMLLSSQQKSFRRFTSHGDGFEFAGSTEEVDSKQVQKGILDFVEKAMPYFEENRIKISGRDAMAPILLLYHNEEWVRYVIDEKKVSMNLE